MAKINRRCMLAWVLIAALTLVAALACAGCGGGEKEEAQPAPSAKEETSAMATADTNAAEPADEDITLGTVCSLTDSKLLDALVAAGFSQKGPEEYGAVTYAKDGVEVIAGEDFGYRMYSAQGDETQDIFAFIQEGAPGLSSLAEYEHEGKSYVVGVCKVAGKDGVIIGTDGAVLIVKDGSFAEIQRIVAGAGIAEDAKAEDAEAAFIKALEIMGFEKVR